MRHPCDVLGQVGPCSPTRAALLSEPIWHQTLWLHQPDTCSRTCLVAEMIHLLVDSFWSFMGCFMCCCHSLQLVLYVADDYFIDSQTLMRLCNENGCAQERMICLQAKSSASMNTCDYSDPGCATSPCQRRVQTEQTGKTLTISKPLATALHLMEQEISWVGKNIAAQGSDRAATSSLGLNGSSNVCKVHSRS